MLARKVMYSRGLQSLAKPSNIEFVVWSPVVYNMGSEGPRVSAEAHLALGRRKGCGQYIGEAT